MFLIIVLFLLFLPFQHLDAFSLTTVGHYLSVIIRMWSHRSVAHLKDYAKPTTRSLSCSLDSRDGHSQGSLCPYSVVVLL